MTPQNGSTGQPQSIANGSLTVDAPAGATTYAVTATSFAGHTTTKSVTTSVDATPPSVQCGSAPTGWQTANVSISCTATDSQSGLPADTNPITLSTSVASGVRNAHAQTNSVQVCDNVGNCTTAGPIMGIAVNLKKASQTIKFAVSPKTLVQSPVTVAATASSGLTVTFTTTTPAVCSAGGVNGATITLIEAGTCFVTASQAGNSVYNTRALTRGFKVSKASQTITFAPLANEPLGQSITVSATASSGLPVTFSTAGDTQNCTSSGVNGATITLIGTAKCTVRASQAGNNVYMAARNVSQSFSYLKTP